MAYNNSSQSEVYKTKFAKKRNSAGSVNTGATSTPSVSRGSLGTTPSLSSNVSTSNSSSTGSERAPAQQSGGNGKNIESTAGGGGYSIGKMRKDSPKLSTNVGTMNSNTSNAGLKSVGTLGSNGANPDVSTNQKLTSNVGQTTQSTPNLGTIKLDQTNSATPESVNKPTQTQSTGLNPINPIQATQATEQQTELQPVNEPTVYDFIEEAKKLGQESTQNQIDILKQNLPEFEQALARSIYGKNVGATSGIGQGIVSNATKDYLGTLTPYISQSGTELGKLALNNQQEELQNAFDLVQSGQITGQQAEETLRQKGIDPASYMTPEQVALRQKDDELNKLKENLINAGDANADLIDSQEEFDYYMTNGKTYEGEVANIVRDAKSLKEWSDALPKLEQAYNDYANKIEHEASKRDIFGNISNKDKYNLYKSQYSELEQIINEVRAGKVPVGNLSQYTESETSSGSEPNYTNKALFGGIF